MKSTIIGAPIKATLAKKSKFHGKTQLTIITVISLLTILLTLTSTYQFFYPNQSKVLLTQLQQQQQQSSFVSSNNSTFTYPLLRDEAADDNNDDEESIECVDISSQPNPCTFIRDTDSCETDGLINWLEFRYCFLGPRFESNFVSTLVAVILIFLCLIVALASLGDTSDTFFVSALTHVATEFKLSPSVAGITFVAFGNASPDILTAVSSVNSGDVLLVIGALSGACVCISFLVMGSAIFASPPDQTTLPKKPFIRNVFGYVICIGAFIICSAKGSFHMYDAIILVSVYGVFLLVNIIYLQRQEYHLREKQKNRRRETFLKSSSSYNNFDERTQLLLTSTHAELPQEFLPSLENKQQFDNNATKKGSYSPPEIVATDGGINSNSHHTSNDIDTSSNTSELTIQTQIQSDDISCALETTVDSDVLINQNNISTDTDKNQSTTSLNALNDVSSVTHDEDDDEDELEADQTVYMHGITWPNPEWQDDKNAVKLGVSIILWLLMYPFALLRWLSIPSTDVRPDQLRSWKKLFLFVSPFFLSLFLLFSLTSGKYEEDDQLLWIIFPAIGLSAAFILTIFYFLSVVPAVEQYNKDRDLVRAEIVKQMSRSDLTHTVLHSLSLKYLEYDLDLEEAKPWLLTLFQIIVALLAFLGSVAWLSAFADEVVNLLACVGLMFGISSTILGLTVLALGNSLPDLISAIALSKRGKITVSYAAVFGAPILSSTLGLAIALFFKFVKHYGTDEAITHLDYKVDPQVILTFAFTAAGLLGHCVVFPLCKWTPTRTYGIVLIGGYFVFLAAAVLLEILS